jgi:predicted transposase/invertase (TIGR01784 family)
VNTELFGQLPAYHLAFRLLEERHQVAFTNDLALHILELPKFTLAAEQLATPQDIWLYFLRHAAELDSDALPTALDRPEIHRAMKELLMLTQNDRERELYEARLKMQRDIRSSQREEREQGRQEGREEGWRLGLAEQIQFCQRLLQRPLTAREDLVALSSAELEQQVTNLQTELANRLGVPPSNS